VKVRKKVWRGRDKKRRQFRITKRDLRSPVKAAVGGGGVAREEKKIRRVRGRGRMWSGEEKFRAKEGA